MTQTNQNKDYSWLDPILDELVDKTSAYIRGEPIAFNKERPKAKAAIIARIDEHYIGKGEWAKYTGAYTKRFYDIKLHSGEVYEECWPNAGTFHEGMIGKVIQGKDVEYVRPSKQFGLYTEEELEQRCIEARIEGGKLFRDSLQKEMHDNQDYTVNMHEIDTWFDHWSKEQLSTNNKDTIERSSDDKR